MPDQDQPFVSPSLRPPLPWRRRLLFGSIFLLYVAALLEIGARCYWKFARELSYLDSSEVCRKFYAEWDLSRVDQVALDPDDGVYDVLILGGSVVNEGFGDIGARLEKGLGERLGRKVRVCNLSFAARTSRDSLIKYRALQSQRVDLVVVYHGINDTRMNACPPTRFRDDYSHCAWYHKIQLFQQHREKRWLAFPFTLHYLAISILDKLPLGMYTPRMTPRDKWLEYGATVKTQSAFRNNLNAIVALAQQRGARVLLMSFAYHLPHVTADGENERDYASGQSLAGIWGMPRHIAAALDAHNQEVQEIVRANANVLYVDQQTLMPKDADRFHDCCHFTEAGCALFVGNILDGVGDDLANP